MSLLAHDAAPLVERDEVLADLLAALDDDTAAITLRGPQGAGRTRLCLELVRRAEERGHPVTLLRGGIGHRRAHAGTASARTLLVVDDADLVTSMPRHPTRALVVRAVRTDRERLAGRIPSAVVDIPPLTLAGTDELLRAWLGGPAISTLVAEAHAASGGRPLWLREWLEAARTTGDLTRRRSLWMCRRTPVPTGRTRELARWAAAGLDEDERDAMRLLGAWDAVPAGQRDGAVWAALEERGWIARDGHQVRPVVPLLARSLCDGTELPRPLRGQGIGVPRVSRAALDLDTNVLHSLAGGDPAHALELIDAVRAGQPANPEVLSRVAQARGLVELWRGSPGARRWFDEAALLGRGDDGGAPAGGRMARALGGGAADDNDSTLDAAARDGDPWLVNPVRARAWELAGRGLPAALRVLDDGAEAARGAGQALTASMLALDALLLDPVPKRAVAVAAELEPWPGPWWGALRGVVDALADGKAAPATRASLLGGAAAELAELGDRRWAAEAYRLAGNLWRGSGRRRDAEEAHSRADGVAAAAGGLHTWVRDLPAALLALPPRQRQITLLAADGNSNQEIAGALDVSLRTVENQLHRAFSELGVTSRLEVADMVADA